MSAYFCTAFVGEAWGGTNCKLRAGHPGDHSAHYPPEPPVTAGSGPQFLRCSTCKGAGMVPRAGDTFTNSVAAAAAYEQRHGGGPVGPVRCSRCDGSGRVTAT